MPRAQHINSEHASLPLKALEQIGEAGDRFESAWQSVQFPQLEEYMQLCVEPLRSALFRHLWQLELHYRQHFGKPRSFDEYRSRIADFDDLLDRAGGQPNEDPTTVNQVGAGGSRTGNNIESPTSNKSLDLPNIRGYEIYEEIGRGGMGIVYRARHLKLDKEVALKLSRKEEYAAVTLQEAKKAAQLEHPHIVHVWEVGEHQGKVFLSMELCPKGNLSNAIPLSAKKAAEIVETVARAVHYAHQNKLIHKDLKPANILLDRDEKPKVADFGLAERVDVSAHSRRGTLVGTPRYMAPEQANGDVNLTKRVDIYGLGAVLYELLTGQPPIQGEEVDDILDQVRSADPAPPRQLRRKLPRDLETICLKCLKKEPKNRYATARALAEDLSRFRRGEPIKARRVYAAERIYKWCRRRPGMSALIVALFVAIIGGAVGVFGQWQRTLDALRTSERLLYNQHITLAERDLSLGRLDHAQSHLEKCLAKFRNWEWRFLWKWTQGKVKVFQGHTEPVTTVVYGPNGECLASADNGGTVRIWKTARPKDSVVLFEHQQNRVAQLAIHPGGDLLACGCFDASAQIWSLPSRKFIHILQKAGSVVGFSSDGNFLACSGKNGKVRIWQTNSWKEPKQVLNHGPEVMNLAFTFGGNYLISAGFGTPSVKIWEWEKGRTIAGPKSSSPAWTLACTSQKKWLATHDGSTALVYDIAESGRKHLPSGYNGRCESLAFSKDDKEEYLAATFRNGIIHIWNVSDGTTVFSAKRGGGIASVGFHPKNTGEIVYFRDNEILIERWRQSRRQAVRAVAEQNGLAVRCLAFSPDGQMLADGGDDGVIRIWNTTSQQLQHTLRGYKGRVTCLSFHPNGKLLAGGSADHTVKLWDVSKAVEITTIAENTGPVTGVAFSQQGRFLAIGSADKSARIWNHEAGEAVAVLHFGSKVNAVAFRPGETQLAVAGETGRLKIWDFKNDRTVHTLAGHRSHVWCTAFSRNGRQLASGSLDDQVLFWDAATGQQIPAGRRGHSGSVFSVAFNGNDRLASGGMDGLIKIWNTATGEEVLTLKGHESHVTSVAFSHDGNLLASADARGAVKIWNGLP